MSTLLVRKRIIVVMSLLSMISILYSGIAYASSGSVYKKNDGVTVGLSYTSYINGNGWKCVKDGSYLGASSSGSSFDYFEDTYSVKLTDSGRTYLVKTTGDSYSKPVFGKVRYLGNKTRSYEFSYRSSY